MVAPLNWGLGHATRCTRIIDSLLAKDVEVMLAADGKAYDLLKLRYPDLELLRFPGYEVKYAYSSSFMLNAIIRLPGFLHSIENEHKFLKKIIANRKPDAIISDNRYGLWSDNVPSYLLTHQISLTASGFWKAGLPFANKLLDYYFKRFTGLWIPDTKEFPGLAGILSHRTVNGLPSRFIGFLSRFNNPAPAEKNTVYDIVAILSGPEPQRSILEKKLLQLIPQTGARAAIVRGLPGEITTLDKKPGISIYNHLPDDEFVSLIRQSRHILCRSGYSGLMDLFKLQRSALIIPTPGQPEQEYLARLHKKSKLFESRSQKQLNPARLQKFISGTEMSGQTISSAPDGLHPAINEIIMQL